MTINSFLGSFSRNLANKMRFGTPKLQIPKYQKWGKMPCWKSLNFIKTLKSLLLRILESVGGVERTFLKVYFFAKNHWFSQIFSKFLLTTNKTLNRSNFSPNPTNIVIHYHKDWPKILRIMAKSVFHKFWT